jgi:PqqD family protein of HPr-rel-A system
MPDAKENRRPKGKGEGRDGGDQYFLYDRSNEEVHVLNATAREIYLLCDGSRTPQQVAAALAEKYGVDEATARRDTELTLRELSELGALDWD